MKTYCVKGFITGVLLITMNIHSQTYGVFFKSFTWTINQDPAWVDSIKSAWYATGVELDLVWRLIENKKGIYSWNDVDKSLDYLLEKGLDISLRVRMGSLLPDWLDFDEPLSDDGLPHRGNIDKKHFHIGHDGKHIWRGEAPLNHNNSNRYLNLTSPASIEILTTYYDSVLSHIKTYFESKNYNKSIEIIPSVNLVSEIELNSDWKMTGYSEIEIDSFLVFLEDKYAGDINTLNKSWGSDFDELRLDNINPRKYDWHEYRNKKYDEFIFPKGRLDWLEFKSMKLKELIDLLATITNKRGFKMGVQLGSIHDYRLDFRGFFDPTSFLEKAHAIRVADIKGYDKTFSFGASYLSSICRFWDEHDSSSHLKDRGFSSETNQHLFGYQSGNQRDYIKNELVPSWNRQVSVYFEHGADRHVIVSWGNSQIDSIYVAGDYIRGNELVKNDSIKSWYASFRNMLKSVSGTPRKIKQNDNAIILSNLYFPFSLENEGRPGSDRFPFFNRILPILNEQFDYPNLNFDIITDYMLKRDPQYIIKYYKKIYNQPELLNQ